MPFFIKKNILHLPFLAAILLGLAILAWMTVPVKAATPLTLPEQAALPTANPLSLSDEYCATCHGQPGQTYALEDGSALELFVDPKEHASSIHGQAGYACVQCHRDVGEYPHPAFSATDRREATFQLNQSCAFCHPGQADKALDSVHARAIANGQREAATCTDCHTAHAVSRINDPATGQILPEAHLWIPQTCSRCHNTIYQKYLTSVHGEALSKGNQDVPTCVECHGVHNIGSPLTAAYRLQSPQMCAHCHTDPQRMLKYGLTTEVLDTYVADFHGTTVIIFEKQSPDAETNKPVCYDCHGVHDILRTDDPQKGLQVRENLLARCQICHPDATADFPASWMSHYYPSPDKYPIVYYVDLFYKFFIPLVLGGMGLMVVLDVNRRMLNRRGNQAQSHEVVAPESPTIAPDTAAVEAPAVAATAEITEAEPVTPPELPKVEEAPAVAETDVAPSEPLESTIEPANALMSTEDTSPTPPTDAPTPSNQEAQNE